jgi:hypothetical protein
MTYAVFIKHQTGDSAVINIDAKDAKAALDTIRWNLGEGWAVTGALEKSPTLRTKPNIRIVTFGDVPTHEMLALPLGAADLEAKRAPHYARFNLRELASEDCTFDKIPGHYLYVWSKKVTNDKGSWVYFTWEYNVGMERAVKQIATNRYGHLVYAMYERVLDEMYKEYPGLYKLVLTKNL